MRSSALIVLLLLSVAGACAKKEVAVVETVPVTVEPTYTGKYK